MENKMAKKDDNIAKQAYLKFLERGGKHGQDVKDWLEAEKEEGKSKPVAKKPTPKKATTVKKTTQKKK
jgi:hypothetical protein